MKLTFYLYLIIVVFVFGIFAFTNSVFAQNEENHSSIVTITGIGLDLTKQALLTNNYNVAEKYSTMTNNFYGKNIQFLRSYNSALSDDIHIELLDLHSSILSKSDSETLINQINKIQELFSQIPFNGNSNILASSILSEADEQYQLAIQQNNLESYFFTQSLVEHSKNTVKQNPSNNDRLNQELDSFFKDLDESISKKQDFTIVGSLITAIQRDLLQTETIDSNKKNTYDKIRTLYSELSASLKSGDYSTAEELGIEAYLDNFEYLESDIEKVDSKLLISLELDMRENLRTMIVQKETPDSILDFVNNSILPDLAKAEALTSDLTSSEDVTPQKDLKSIGDTTEDQKSDVKNNIDTIRERLEDTLVHYARGDFQSAHTSARSAYLDSYEYVEIPLRAIDPDFTLEVEYQFATLRNLIKEQAPQKDVQDIIIDIRRNLDESERIVTGTGEIAPAIAFTSSFAVIFREGLESVLILGAILTYLEASRNTKFKPYIYYGIVLALVATIITWLVTSYIIDISGASRELVEAIAALSATAVLFYVSFWILNKIEHKKWMEFVKAKVWQAGVSGGFMVFVMLSFFTVYREGFETVLFYQAMFAFAKYMELYVGLGFVLGIASLLGLFFVMRKLGKRLPLRVLFGLTMGIGAYLSVAFLGNAIRELQILDVIPYTSMFGIIPRLDINLAAMTGIYPTLETTIGQIILLAVYLFAASYVLIFKPRREQKLVAMRKSRNIPNE
ncbi:FTR1 family iron permease [Candidatus Nitrosarchaeum limnium]|uniref:FTR1 family protein n=1 Tax=Candidatus Nitrosarchaeum limnium BG20 TaxID=859192 RepID=S2E778_9ARCH|nr:FTR1 family protein [Candidatus Nitrosarchaeum limnium]EPA06558.1 FTR1 family protein [Candidatus Nitrosarchaeum limnium BG20]